MQGQPGGPQHQQFRPVETERVILGDVGGDAAAAEAPLVAGEDQFRRSPVEFDAAHVAAAQVEDGRVRLVAGRPRAGDGDRSLTQRHGLPGVPRARPQGRHLAPQAQRFPVQGVRDVVHALGDFVPVEFGSNERLFRLRVGDARHGLRVRETREAGELLAPALGDEAAEFGVVVREVQERRRGHPLLPLEDDRDVRREAEQRARRPVALGAATGVQALAEGAVAHLVVVGDAVAKGVRRQVRAGRAALAVRARNRLAAVEPAVGQGLGEFLRAAGEVPQVRIPFACQGHADAVVEVVRPQTVQPAAALGLGHGEGGGVALVLGVDEAAPRMDGFGDFGEDVSVRLVHDGVSRVEAEAVEVELLHPEDRVFPEVIPHRAVVVAVEVERVAPRGFVRGIEVILGVRAEVVAVGAEVVVDGVEDHADPLGVRRVHQGAQVVRMAVGARGRVEEHAVVAPVPAAREVGQRHDLDGRDTQVPEVIELADGGEERALARERADVQLVDDERVQRHAAMVGVVLPGVLPGRHDLRGTVDAPRLVARERVGERPALVTVEPVLIQVALAPLRVRALEIPVACRSQQHGAQDVALLGEEDHFHPLLLGSPDPVEHAGLREKSAWFRRRCVHGGAG